LSCAPGLEKVKEELAALLDELVNVAGVTGFEDAVRHKIAALLEPTGAQLDTDHMGNLYAAVPGRGNERGNRPAVMLCAHMDEVGFVVSNIDAEGFIYLYPLGGIPDHLGPGEWVSLQAGETAVQGVIGMHPPHLPAAGGHSIFVDVGARSRDEVLQMGLDIGTPAIFTHSFRRLGSGRVAGRCLDNRMGCAVLIALLRRLPDSAAPAAVTCVFSTTEEHGMLPGSKPGPVYGARGALVAAMKLRPDLAVVVDSMAAGDIPGTPGHSRQIRLGGGTALRLVDDLTIMRPGMRSLLKKIAAANGIPVQEGMSRSYTDASAVQLAGVPVAALGIPLRYGHSPAQVADLEDMAQTLLFLQALLNNVDKFCSV